MKNTDMQEFRRTLFYHCQQ